MIPFATRRVIGAVGILLGITLAGMLGYVFVEGATPLDALYMTVITISTVGYREVFPLSDGGKIFTILLVVVGVGAALFVLSVLAEWAFAGSLRDFYRRSFMLRSIEGLRDHIVVCGFGRFGRVVVSDLRAAGRDVVIIESDAELLPLLEESGVPFLLGSATSDEKLELSGIQRAAAIVVATSSESDCVFVTLAARELNPSIQIHARSEGESAVRRLRRAGADHVTSPLQMGGTRAAASILRPSVVDFLEISAPRRGEEIDLEEIRVAAGSALAESTVESIETGAARLRIVALKRGAAPIEIVPDRNSAVQVGDHLVVIGERDELSRLAQRAEPGRSSQSGQPGKPSPPEEGGQESGNALATESGARS